MANWLKTTAAEHKGFLLFITLMLIFRSAVADWNFVPSGSMQPTIVEGDYILIDKLAYDVRIPFTLKSLRTQGHPERGDIVVFESERADKRLVKRVIGIPGDEIRMTNNRLSVNGTPVAYTQVSQADTLESLPGKDHKVRLGSRRSEYGYFNPTRVPDNYYLMLGDNRNHSADSRVYGFVPRGEIIGRAEHVLMSFDLDNYLAPRWERFGERLQ